MTSPTRTANPLQLLPVPRQIERGGAGAAVDAPAQAIRDTTGFSVFYYPQFLACTIRI